MIVATVEQPNLVRDARGIRAERIVVALHVHNAFSLLFFLTDHVAENTALFVFKPFVRGTQFVFDTAWYEDCRGDLRMRMRPLFARERALILEHANVFETRIFLEIGNTRGPYPKHAFDFFVGELG